MCIICVSKSGAALPTDKTIRTMFRRNPHGAGYMFARNGRIHIHKGFMCIDDYLYALRSDRLTAEDSVVYHFRISTQAGVNPEMTHPFPLSNQLRHMQLLDLNCPCGIAHNGVIPLTTDPTNRKYSDTALFITRYLSEILHTSRDLHSEAVLNQIRELAQSKLAIMDGSGYVATVGDFRCVNGILYSNDSFREWGC